MTRRRLKQLAPQAVARDAVRARLQRLTADALALDPIVALPQSLTDEECAQTALYKVAVPLASFAVHGAPKLTAKSYDREVSRLVGLLGYDQVIQAVPQTDLAACIAAGEARFAVIDHVPLTSMQVALLTDRDRDHVNILAGKGEIPGAYRSDENRHQPWRFRVDSRLIGWLALHGLPGL